MLEASGATSLFQSTTEFDAAGVIERDRVNLSGGQDLAAFVGLPPEQRKLGHEVRSQRHDVGQAILEGGPWSEVEGKDRHSGSTQGRVSRPARERGGTAALLHPNMAKLYQAALYEIVTKVRDHAEGELRELAKPKAFLERLELVGLGVLLLVTALGQM
ncbi:hypothetical protein [Bradyrhizobium sp. USDA 4516]